MDPKLDVAFQKAIKAYFEDAELTEYDKISPDRKYKKKYFDSIESEHLGEIYPKTEKQRRKAKQNADK